MAYQAELAEIDASNLTNEAKEVAKKQAEATRDAARVKIDSAKDNDGVAKAKDAGVTTVAKPTHESPIKATAVAAIDTAAEQAKANIDALKNLSEAEKQLAKAKVDEEVRKQKEQIQNATSADEVKNLQNVGINTILQLPKTEAAKEDGVLQAPIKEVTEKAKQLIAALPSDLTDEERQAATDRINQEAAKQIEVLQQANEGTVDDLKTKALAAVEGAKPLASSLKTAAKDSIAKAIELEKQEIDSNDGLNSDEKKVAKQKIDAKQAAANQAIDAATSNAEVQEKLKEQLAQIVGQFPQTASASQAALSELEKAAAAKKADIAADKGLTTEEQAELIKQVETKLEKAKEAVAAAQTNDIANAKDNQVAEINGVTKADDDREKAKAKKLVEAAATAKKEQVAANNKLTVEEKALETAKIAAEQAKQLAEIDKKTSTAEVKDAGNTGKGAIDKLQPAQKSAVKEAAIASLDKVAEAEKAEIQANTKLQEAQKTDATRAIDEKLAEVTQAITDAEGKTNAEIFALRDAAIVDLAGKTPIPGGATPKQKDALKEIDTKVTEAFKTIDDNPALTDDEKTARKLAVLEAAGKAKADVTALDDTANDDAINNAKNADSITNAATPVGTTIKESAKVALEAEKAKALEAIDASTLTDEEKAKAKEAVEAAVKKVTDKLDGAGVDDYTTNVEIAQAQADATAALEALKANSTTSPAKEAAKLELAKEAAQKLVELDQNRNLTTEERDVAKAKVEKALAEAKAEIDKTTDGKGIAAAKANFTNSLNTAATVDAPAKAAAKAELDAVATAKKAEIDKDGTLIAEEKIAEKAKVDAATKQAQADVDLAADENAVAAAKAAGNKAITDLALPTEVKAKEIAKAALDKAAEQAKAEIAKIPGLTAEEVTAESNKVNDKLAEEKAKLDKKTSNSELLAAQVAAERELAAIPVAVANSENTARKAAAKALTDKAQELIAALETIRPVLTAEEKQAATDRINQALVDAIGAINKAPDASIDTKKATGLEALAAAKPTGSAVKTAAVAALNKVLEAEIAAIDRNPNLNPAEKAAATEKLQAAKREGEEAVNGATTEADLQAKLRENLAKLSGQQLGTMSQAALLELEKAAAAKKADIDADKGLTEEEKTELKGQVDAKLATAKTAINDAPVAGIDAAKVEQLEAINAVVKPEDAREKAKAKKLVEDAATAKKEEVAANNKLTVEEKALETAKIDAEQAKQLAEIDKKTSTAEVKDAGNTGKGAIDKLQPAQKSAVKEAAIASLDKVAEAEKAEIQANTKLQEAQKTDATRAIDEKLAEVTQAITDAEGKTNAEIFALRDAAIVDLAGKTPIPGGATPKQKDALKEIDTKVTEAFKTIDDNPALTDDEKTARKLAVLEAAGKAKADVTALDDTANDDAINNAKNADSITNAATPVGTTIKESAKVALEAEKAKALEAIDASTLTDEEKAKAKEAVEAAVKKVTDKLDGAGVDDYTTNVEIAQAQADATAALEALKANSTTSPAKEAAKLELAKEAAQKLVELDQNRNLTTEERDVAKAKVEKALAEAKAEIDKTTDGKGIAAAKANFTNSLNTAATVDAPAKAAAKAELDAVATAKKAEIDKDGTLIAEEKIAEKAKVDAATKQAQADVDLAADENAVAAAKAAGNKAITDLALPTEVKAKEIAKAALDKAAEQAKAEIAKIPGLTAEEVTAESNKVNDKLAEEKAKLDKKTSNSELLAAQVAAERELAAIPVAVANSENTARKAAAKALTDKAQELIAALETIRPVLTAEEKQAATDRINQALVDAIGAINKAPDASIDTKKATGLEALAAAKPTGSAVKTAAVAALNKVLEAEIAAIDRNPNLNPAEKAAATEKLQAAKREGEEAVNGATTEADLQAKLRENLAKLSGQQLGTMSQAALLELEKAAAAKKADIDADKGLTEEEKTELKGQVDAKLATAKTAINDAPVAGIDAAKVEQLEAINAVVKPEDAREKAKAKKLVEDAATAKKEEVAANNKLTVEEKALETAKIDAEQAKQLAEIDKKTSTAEVKDAGNTGKGAIDKLQPAQKSAVKEAAIASLDKVAEAEKAEIQANTKLQEAQKTDATRAIDEKLAEVTQAITDAEGKTNAEIFALRDAAIVDLAGKTPIPGGATPKQKDALKEIDTKVTEAFKTIDDNPALTDDEKTARKLAVLEAAGKAKADVTALDDTANDDAINNAKNADSITNAATPVGTTIKESAKVALEAEKAKALEAIDASTLTDEEKAKAKEAVEAAVKKVTDKLDGAGVDDYTTNVEIAQAQADATAALEALKANSTTSPAKEAAKLELAKEAAQKLVELDQNRNLTTEERDVAKAKVEKALAEAKAEIDKTTDGKGIAAAKANFTNSLNTAATVDAPAKAAAKAELDAVATAKKAEIDKDGTLIAEEKIAEKAKVDAATKQAQADVDLAADENAVAAAKAAGNKAITDLALPTEVKAKEIAKAALDKAAEQAKAEIAKIPGLTAEEVTAESNKVNDKLAEEKAKLDKKTSNSELLAAQVAAERELAAIPVAVANSENTARKAAAKALTDKAQELIAALETIRPVLTAEEKQAATDRINQALVDAIGAINKAPDASIDTKKATGLEALAAAKPTGSAVKTAAVAALNKVLEAEIAAIDRNPNLNPAEKAAATEKLQAAKREGEEAVNGATTEADLQAKLRENLAKLSGQQLGTMSQAALLELEKAAAAKKADIDADKGLTEEEKTELKGQVDAKLATAKTAINDAPVAGIDAAKVEQLEAINAVVKPEDAREKAKAKKLVEDAATAKKEEVAANNKLTVEEKALETAKIDAEQAKQLAEIDKKTSTAEVKDAGNTGKGAIDKLQPAQKSAVKEAAIASLDKVAEAEKAEIQANTKLQEAQKTDATRAIDEKLAEVTQAITDAEGKTNAEIFALRDAAIVDLAGKTPIPGGATPKQKDALKEIDTKVTEAFKTIDDNPALTDDEKTARKLAVLEAAGKAKADVTALDDTANDDAINNAKNADSITNAATPVGTTIKESAKVALEAEKAKALEAIDASTLTDEEKAKAKEAVEAAVKKVTDKLDGAGVDDYTTNVEIAQAQADATAALEALKANSTTSPAKEAAKLELAKEAAQKLVELDQNRNLTTEERDVAKAKVEKALAEAKAEIDKTTDGKGIAAAKANFTNSLNTAATVDAPAKAAAKAELDAVATAKKAEIDKDGTLIAEEKIAEKAKVDAATKQAQADVDLAADENAVAAAKAAGNKAITDLALPTEVKAKEIAKAALDKAAEQAKAEIAKIPGLTAEEVTAESNKVNDKLAEEKAKLDKKTSNSELLAAQVAAERELAAIPVAVANSENTARKAAAKALTDKAQELIAALETIRPVLTAEEKQAATDRINQALVDAIGAINKAPDASIDTKKATGLEALAAAKPTGSAVKTAAVAALNKVLEAEIAAIDRNPNLNPAEKAAATEKLQAAKREGEEAVNGATTEADLQAKLRENLAKLSGQQLGTMSQAALLELEKAAAAKKADIDADKGLTEEEKTELKGQVDAKLATAKTAINDAPVAGIDAAKVEQLEAINAVVKPEDAREKAKAKKLVEDAATAKKEEVAANNKLTVEEKALETAKIDAEQAKQLAEIDKKTSTAEVKDAGNTGKGAIDKLQPAQKSAVKEAAIASLDKVAEAEKAEIQANTKLQEAQKTDATRAIDEKLAEVTQAITDAEGKTNAEIFALRDAAIVDLAGKTPIPGGATPKQKDALKEIDTKVTEAFKTIDDNPALTDDEKTARKLAVLEAAGKAKADVTALDDTANDDAINNAKNADSITNAATPVGTTIKESAKVALEAEKAKALEAIDASTLTDEEKAKAKEAVEAAVKKVTDKLDGAGVDDYTTNVEIAQAQADATAALEALKANSTTSPAKEAAKLELAKEAAQKLVELDQNRNLTTEERDVAKAKVEKALAEAKAEIDKTTDGKGIAAAKANFTNSLNTAATVDAPAKAAAKAELDAVATAKKAEIDKDGTLIAEEKIAEKAKVDAATKQAQADVDLAADENAVAAAKAAGNKAITDLALPTEVKAKEIAKAALDKAAEQAKAEIAKIPGLTAEEVTAESNKVNDKLAEEKAKLDKKTSNSELLAAQVAAERELAAIPVAVANSENTARKAAAKALTDKAQELIAALETIRPVLTAEEKQAATDRINQALVDAIGAINKAPDASIDTKKATGLEALAAAKPTGSAVKTAAVAALNKVLEAEIAAIDRNPNLNPAEKAAATEKLQAAKREGEEAVNGATTEADLQAKLRENLAKLSGQQLGTTSQPIGPEDQERLKEAATLPSTGETNSSLLEAYGALGLMAGLGLVARKKRRDDEA